MSAIAGGRVNRRDYDELVTVCLLGDMMPGRGIDQILPHAGDPALRERAVEDARFYVRAAERQAGTIDVPVDFSWPWGDALEIMEEVEPDVRVLNMESSITDNDAFEPAKSVHYRMHPANLRGVSVGRPDLCALANNHVLDFGTAGLTDTLDTLQHAGLRYAGAGVDAEQAAAPALLPVVGNGRVVALACATTSAGVATSWTAGAGQPGVNVVANLSETTATRLAEQLRAVRRDGDIALLSIHWGSNWGYQVPREHVRFAHRLIDEGVDIVHGHSSHHPRPVELYRDRLILYGCGDFIDDYEGISAYEQYRDDLRPLYFADMEPETGSLRSVRIALTQTQRMRLHRASISDIAGMQGTLTQISAPFGTRFEAGTDGWITVAGGRQS